MLVKCAASSLPVRWTLCIQLSKRDSRGRPGHGVTRKCDAVIAEAANRLANEEVAASSLVAIIGTAEPDARQLRYA